MVPTQCYTQTIGNLTMEAREEEDFAQPNEMTVLDRQTATDVRSLEDDLLDDGGKSGSSPRTVTTLSKIADELQSATPVISNVAVTNSENVQFGNNTYFNGPVVIRQIIQSNAGLDNVAYTKSENEDFRNNTRTMTTPSKSDDDTMATRRFHIKTWHKLLIVLVSVVMVSVACSLALTGSDANSTSNTSRTTSKGSPSEALLVAKHHLRWVSRNEWLAQPPSGELDPIALPVPWVIVAHTATESCLNQSECVLRTRIIQQFHVESKKWFDIGYNFLIGGDGSVYVGRGWDYVGAHTKSYNQYSIGIAFIGSFNIEKPTDQQFDAFKKVLRIGVELGKLDKNYKLLAHRQLWATASPGDNVYDVIKDWPHFLKNTTGALDGLPEFKKS